MKPQPRNASRSFAVARAEDGTPLQDFLAAKLGLSRRAAKQQIDARVVRVDGQSVWMAHHRLRAGAVVTVAGVVDSPTAVSKRPDRAEILFEDADFLVADKPGAFGTIASILGRHGVSISAASQKDISANGNSTYVPVVALMHAAKTSELEAALAEIKSSGVVDGDPVKLRMI